MTDVARISQMTVSKSGVFIRMEAIRTEKHQNRYKPLEMYWNIDSVDQRAQSWRQLLMFFIRTQKEHTWKSPAYRFTQRQSIAFKRLIREARKLVDKKSEEGEESEESEESEEGEENVEGESDRESSEEDEDVMTAIRTACLNFCIELLNEKIQFNEYDSALVCAMAVLGVSETGWRGPESYPPILSAVIKCARFMVFQKAVMIGKPATEDGPYLGESAMDFDDDSGYESNSSGSSIESRCSSTPIRSQASPNSPFSSSGPIYTGGRAGGRVQLSSLKWVGSMMDQFMVRGSHGPVQWMLDLRTYGLKIHFNTTSRGHVEWCNGDELLYKSAQFNMDQFRGMVYRSVEEARDILFKELLFCEPEERDSIPKVPWDKLRDNPTETRVG